MSHVILRMRTIKRKTRCLITHKIVMYALFLSSFFPFYGHVKIGFFKQKTDIFPTRLVDIYAMIFITMTPVTKLSPLSPFKAVTFSSIFYQIYRSNETMISAQFGKKTVVHWENLTVSCVCLFAGDSGEVDASTSGGELCNRPDVRRGLPPYSPYLHRQLRICHQPTLTVVSLFTASSLVVFTNI